MNKIIPLFLSLLFSGIGASQIELVKDINPNGASLSGLQRASSQNTIVLDSLMYFVANDDIHGEELWISDGTAAGTRLVKDIWEGKTGSSITRMTIHGNEVYFYAEDSLAGAELWKTDGTTAGTVMVADANPGSDGSANLSFDDIISLGDILIYEGYDPINGQELRWVNENGDQGILEDLSPGRRSSSFSSFCSFDGKMYFSGPTDAFRGNGFYEVNQEAEIRKIQDIDGNIDIFIDLGDIALMQNQFGFNKQLQYYDPNKDEVIHSIDLPTNETIVDYLPVENGIIYTINRGTNKNAVFSWVDGDTTLLFKFDNFFNNAPILLTEFKGEHYCYGFDGRGDGLYKMDLINKSTELVFEFQGSIVFSDRVIFANKEFMLISAEESSFGGVDRGFETYKSDGTTSGTSIIRDLNPGTEHSDPVNYRELYPGLILFAANDGQLGHELYKYSYTPTTVSTNATYVEDWIAIQPTASKGCYYIEKLNHQDSKMDFRVINSVGQVLKTGKLGNQICLEGYSAGHYVIQVEFNGMQQNVQVIKL